MGKIGLPLAVQFASKGHQVLGADINTDVVRMVNEGVEPFPGEAGLPQTLKQCVAAGNLSATVDTTAAVRESEVVVVVVPLFVNADAEPDFQSMDSATKLIGAGLKPGTLVSYETTLPIGTTRERFTAALEATSGLTVGTDFHVVFSPERVLTGRIFSDLRRYPKLVGGVTAVCEEVGAAFYEQVLDFDLRDDLPRPNGVWRMGSSEASEFAKLAETTYRDVNIGLANQFARFADAQNIDIMRVIEASNSQPYSHIHLPGIAVGGHCIPIYPQFYLWQDPSATVVASARATNRSMPLYCVERLSDLLGGLSDQRISVMGASYRGGVKETAFSGVFDVVRELKAAGAIVSVHDPMFSDDELTALGFTPHHLDTPVDAVVVQSDHSMYRSLGPDRFPGVRGVLDGRRILDRSLWADVPVRMIGMPTH